MRSDLLLEVADMLDALTPTERAHFNMADWCSTNACAIGWACLKLKSVQEAGLFIRQGFAKMTELAHPGMSRMAFGRPMVILKSPRTGAPLDYLTNTQAVRHVFQLDNLNALGHWLDTHGKPYSEESGGYKTDLTHALFFQHYYPVDPDVDVLHPEDVSKRIREAVAHYDPTCGQSSTTSASTTSPSESCDGSAN